ncbi:hypothetical protein CMI42_05610 [Candidatus Pacearchaeota archaeon]|nr:hypothetical protein [Candidatus Pacearchaeota archaeon]|tara:strand:+ start:2170 stop:2403 length:234 start_codon:yes stop_codon:yes gene_type:complete
MESIKMKNNRRLMDGLYDVQIGLPASDVVEQYALDKAISASAMEIDEGDFPSFNETFIDVMGFDPNDPRSCVRERQH